MLYSNQLNNPTTLISHPNLQPFIKAFSPLLAELRLVGGAVRDHLLGLVVSDLDIAASLTPEQIINYCITNNIPYRDYGAKYGTVMVIVSHYAYEITSLRHDTAPDGRYTNVSFTNNWQEDASRRDFTINALYLDFEGNLHDYYDGIEDLALKKVRFIGDPRLRIAEDYLRIIRYARFMARFANPNINAIPKLESEAIRQALPKLAILSRERILSEFSKAMTKPGWLKMLDYCNKLGISQELFGNEFSLTPDFATERSSKTENTKIHSAAEGEFSEAYRWALALPAEKSKALADWPLPRTTKQALRYMANPLGKHVSFYRLRNEKLKLLELLHLHALSLNKPFSVESYDKLGQFNTTAQQLLERGVPTKNLNAELEKEFRKWLGIRE